MIVETVKRSKLVRGSVAAMFVLSVSVLATVVAPAGAQQEEPTASAVSSCRNEEGYIHVTIEDDFVAVYNIFINGELVDEEVVDGIYNYGPFVDGSYQVEVFWLVEGSQLILDTTLEIDCVPDETTTTTAAPTTTTTEAPAETTTTAPAPAAAPIPVAPTYTG